MANLQVKDGAAADKYLKSSGVGSDGDPHIPEHLETNSAALLTAAQAIQAAVEILDNIVSGTEAQVDVVAALPAGTNNIGDVDVATIAAGETHIGNVGGEGTVVETSYTRPSNTTAYTAEDAVSDSTSSPNDLVFASCVRNNGDSGVISHVMMIDSANQSTKGEFELWLFDTAPTATNDNSAFALSDANANDVVAVIPLTTVYVGNATSGAGGNAVYDSGSLMRHFTCGGSDTDLYGLLKVTNAYTPVSAEVFTIRLFLLQD